MKKALLVSLLAFAVFAACKKDSGNDTPTIVNPGDSLTFAGYDWMVTNSNGEERQPGPNIYDPSYAWVDKNGFLHIKIAKGPDGKFHCAEIEMTQSLGYGTYQWFVDGPIDRLDKNVVFGMFNYSGNDGFDEMDIEYSQWGYADNEKKLGYTVWPETGSSGDNVYVEFELALTGNTTTQRFTRTKDSVVFTSCNGFHDDDQDVYARQTFTNPPSSISPLAMPVFMNLWLYGGVQPPNNYSVEIVIHNFKFTPL